MQAVELLETEVSRFFFCLLIVMLLLSACSAETSARYELWRVAGPGAIDCGMVRVHDDRSKTIACVEAALQSGESFYAGWKVRGVDSQIWHGVARRKGEQAVTATYDSDIYGSDIPLLRTPSFTTWPCLQPKLPADELHHLSCGEDP